MIFRRAHRPRVALDFVQNRKSKQRRTSAFGWHAFDARTIAEN